jgi:hypothetical protein
MMIFRQSLQLIQYLKSPTFSEEVFLDFSFFIALDKIAEISGLKEREIERSFSPCVLYLAS